MIPVTFIDKYFSITSFGSCVQYWLVEDCPSPLDFHSSLGLKLDLESATLKGRTI